MASFRGAVIDRAIKVIVFLSNPRNTTAGRWVEFRAVVDTGATVSGITHNVASRLNLTPGRDREVETAGPPILTPEYLVRIALVIGRRPEFQNQPAETNWLTRTISSIQIHTDRRNSRDMLLGMDFLQHCHLSVFGDTFILSN